MSGPPCGRRAPEPLLDRAADARVLGVEQVDEVGEFAFGQVVDALVRLGRTALAEAERRVGEVGAEALQLDAVGAARRLEVDQGGELVDDGRVVVRRLAGEAVEEVPGAGRGMVLALAQGAHVAGAGDSLVHEVEDPAARALDAGLDVDRAGLAEEPELPGGEVGLDLVVQPQVPAALGDAGQEVAEVGHVDDVVDGDHVEEAVTADQLVDLLPQPLARLGPEGHRGAVEPAQGAVVLLAPPAAAGTLGHQLGVDVLLHR